MIGHFSRLLQFQIFHFSLSKSNFINLQIARNLCDFLVSAVTSLGNFTRVHPGTRHAQTSSRNAEMHRTDRHRESSSSTFRISHFLSFACFSPLSSSLKLSYSLLSSCISQSLASLTLTNSLRINRAPIFAVYSSLSLSSLFLPFSFLFSSYFLSFSSLFAAFLPPTFSRSFFPFH